MSLSSLLILAKMQKEMTRSYNSIFSSAAEVSNLNPINPQATVEDGVEELLELLVLLGEDLVGEDLLELLLADLALVRVPRFTEQVPDQVDLLLVH